MRLYNGLVKLDKDRKIEDVMVVKEGFSFCSFLFNPLWFLFYRMWYEFFGVITIFLLINFFEKNWLQNGFVLQLTFVIMVALNARSWLVESLIQCRKYEFVTIIIADNADNAKIKLIKYLIEKYETDPALIFSKSILDPIDISSLSFFPSFKFFEKKKYKSTS